MMGTSWLSRVTTTFHALDGAWKALPQPGALYQNQGFGNPQPGYLVWPGWDQYEKDRGGRDETNVKRALQSPWVFSDVRAIANEFSAAELMVKERKSDKLEEVKNHPLEVLWGQPNDHMGPSFVSSFWAQSYTLVGKAYLYWLPNSAGELAECWPVPPFMMRPERDPKTFIPSYLFRSRPDAPPIRIPVKYITYSHSVNLFDMYDGLSFIAAAMLAINGDISAAQWNANFFSENNGLPDGMIAVNKDTNNTDLQTIRMELRDFFGGTKRGIAVARAGDFDYKQFGRSQKDMEFNSLREFASREIGRTLGFPDGYWSETANRANAEQARATMIAGAVWPLLKNLAEDMNAQLLPTWYGKQYRAEFKDIRPEDRSLKIQETQMRTTYWLINELREADGKEPLEDPRGLMLVAEINKGTPIPATPASNETEDAIAAQEADAGIAPPEDTMSEDEATDEAAQAEPVEPAVDVFSKATDLDRWERKAIKRLKDKGNAAAPFASDTIDTETHARINAALKAAQSVEDIRAAFDDTEDEALAWAKQVLE